MEASTGSSLGQVGPGLLPRRPEQGIELFSLIRKQGRLSDLDDLGTGWLGAILKLGPLVRSQGEALDLRALIRLCRGPSSQRLHNCCICWHLHHTRRVVICPQMHEQLMRTTTSAKFASMTHHLKLTRCLANRQAAVKPLLCSAQDVSKARHVQLHHAWLRPHGKGSHAGTVSDKSQVWKAVN